MEVENHVTHSLYARIATSVQAQNLRAYTGGLKCQHWFGKWATHTHRQPVVIGPPTRPTQQEDIDSI